jgi:hypothetical protein
MKLGEYLSKSIVMIEENEVKSVICNDIPELAIDLSMIKEDREVYRSIECLTDYAKEVIRAKDMSAVRQAFLTAYSLLREGSFVVKSGVVNIFINSVSRIVNGNTKCEKNIRAEFFRSFGKEYNKLIYCHSI